MSDTTTPKRNEAVAYVFPNTLQELERYRERGMDSAYGIAWAMPGEDGRASEPLYSQQTIDALQGRLAGCVRWWMPLRRSGKRNPRCATTRR